MEEVLEEEVDIVEYESDDLEVNDKVKEIAGWDWVPSNIGEVFQLSVREGKEIKGLWVKWTRLQREEEKPRLQDWCKMMLLRMKDWKPTDNLPEEI
ncbi:hypothetical protein E2562_023397 [Oryza meyeriana var. granulata]|uniref:Uncharacterized protein n=1 Tax=Oryza meyeriana var. granulata TaxID=110450 RepID=A0A6G1E187_9ORYZ|nr:hypothetical protein E2562_023397 [Oryza meyeriana var. granulata]